MSEVTTISSATRPEPYEVRAARQASPDSTRQVAKQSGSTLPLSGSQEAKENQRQVSEVERQEQTSDNVRSAVAKMNEYVQAHQRDLRFSIDQDSGETIVKVLDRTTEEVIRQIPDEIFLKLARSLSVNEPVHFFSEQA